MTTTDQADPRLASQAPSDQRQFEQELSLVVAVATQLCPKASSYLDAVDTAIELIRAADAKLKRFYEQPKTPTPETKPEPPVQAPLQPRPSRKVVEESITAASKVIIAKKLRTLPELEAMVQAYGARTKSQLTDEQAVELMEKLKSLTKEK